MLDGIVVAKVIGDIWHWLYTNYYIMLYKWRGKSNGSFVDYAMALAYENEYVAYYRRNKRGQGEVILETIDGNVYVGSNNKGTYTIALLDAYHAEPYQEPIVKATYEELSQNDKEVTYYVVDKGAQGLYLNIETEIKADPKEKDAEYYITGYIESVLVEKQKKLASTFRKYKEAIPCSTYDLLNKK